MDAAQLPEVPVGVFKTFGPLGPIYQVEGAVHPSPAGEWLVSVLLVESGERVDYPLSAILQDPEAA